MFLCGDRGESSHAPSALASRNSYFLKISEDVAVVPKKGTY